ncbi:uncharacterized protein LOC110812231 isoform X1 [Carica papaya]|uniref:uncharacterized protein LOC110812231 isoform X1 n=1 Tax=Carica papaya TaxID=3649 RepID=UPI000B8CDCAC|nr:uncharacterized protein LOC110812231 isoform X1 [Carica papaya]
MGLWDTISDSFKDKTRDGPSFTDAASRIGTAVAVHCFEKLVTSYFSSEELRSNKTELAASVAKDAAFYACKEAIKNVSSGGLPFHGILPKSLHHDSKPDEKNEEMKALLAKLETMEKALMQVKANEKEKELQAQVDRLEKALQARSSKRTLEKNLSFNRRSMLNQLQVHNLSAGLIKGQYAAPQLDQKPVDVIKDFVEKDFMKNYLSSNLKFPGARFRSKS